MSHRSIADVAAELAVSTRTLRSWERRYGLVRPTRTAGGHRRYSADDVERLRALVRLSRSKRVSEAVRELAAGGPA